MFPALDFELDVYEDFADFAFRGQIRAGQLDLRRVSVIWQKVDPKTGEHISGSREEIEQVLGSGGSVTVSADKKTDDLPF
jgi:hypothetical protein